MLEHIFKTGSILRERFLAPAVFAIALSGPIGFASVPASKVGPAVDNDLRQALRLLEKDDDDVVIKAEELPQVIRDYIAKDMPAGKITEARKDYKGNKSKTGDKFTYEVDVKDGNKEYELRFSNDGKFLKKRENAGDEPVEKK